MASIVKPSSSSTTIPLPDAIPEIPLKLDGNNYILWRTIMVPLLRAYQLFGYADGSIPAPPQTLPARDGGETTGIPNPEFHDWMIRDQFTLTAILFGVTEDVGWNLIGASSSREAWARLATLFDSRAFARDDDFLELEESSRAQFELQTFSMHETDPAAAHGFSRRRRRGRRGGCSRGRRSRGRGFRNPNSFAEPGSREGEEEGDDPYQTGLGYATGPSRFNWAQSSFHIGPNFPAQCGQNGPSCTERPSILGPDKAQPPACPGVGPESPICQLCEQVGHIAISCPDLPRNFGISTAHLAHGTAYNIRDLDWYIDSDATQRLSADFSNLDIYL